jgi:biopolymer transport protein ExbD
MLLKKLISFKGYLTFNITPVIDIVFLLIIFFIFAFRYITAENFAIIVPDEASNAIIDVQQRASFITLSVWYDDDNEQFFCAVGSDVVDVTDKFDTTAIVALINQYCEKLNTKKAVVNLRINRDMVFKNYSDVLNAVSLSNVTELSIAALEDQQK